MRFWISIVLFCFISPIVSAADVVDYRILATSKTSTMQKEMNEAAETGFRFGAVMGGETAFGGKEVIATMYKLQDAEPAKYEYKLLATSKTSTMQKEIQEAGNAGFEYRGQTVFESAFGGKEVVIILERDKTIEDYPMFEYKLLATSKTSTMQKELQEAGESGFEFVGVTVSSTTFGGREVVSILRKKAVN